MSELSPLASGADPWAALDASLLLGGSTASSDDTSGDGTVEDVEGLYDSTLPSALAPTTGTYDASGTLTGTASSTTGQAGQFDGASSADASATAADQVMAQAESAGPTAGAEVIDDALPALIYGADGSFLDGTDGSTGVDLFG